MLDTIHTQRVEYAKIAAPNNVSNCHLGFITTDGLLVNLGSGPCHGAYQYGRGNLRKQKFLVWSVQESEMEKKFVKIYIDWLVNQSPWSSVFLTKDVEDILKLGFVADPTKPENLVFSACIASRFPWEKYNKEFFNRRVLFKALLGAGVSVKESFLFSLLFSPSKAGAAFPVTFSPLVSGHNTFDFTSLKESYLRNFLDNNPVNLSKRSFVDAGGGGSTQSSHTWEFPGKTDAFLDWMRKLKPKSFGNAKDHHIFRKAPKTGVAIPDEEGLLNVIAQIKERIYA